MIVFFFLLASPILLIKSCCHRSQAQEQVQFSKSLTQLLCQPGFNIFALPPPPQQPRPSRGRGRGRGRKHKQRMIPMPMLEDEAEAEVVEAAAAEVVSEAGWCC